MNTLTLEDVERELLDIADDWEPRDRILALARRIAVQVETVRLNSSAGEAA